MERSRRVSAAAHQLPAPQNGRRRIHLKHPCCGAEICPAVICADLRTSDKVGLEVAAQAGRIATVRLFLPPSPLPPPSPPPPSPSSSLPPPHGHRPITAAIISATTNQHSHHHRSTAPPLTARPSPNPSPRGCSSSLSIVRLSESRKERPGLPAPRVRACRFSFSLRWGRALTR